MAVVREALDQIKRCETIGHEQGKRETRRMDFALSDVRRDVGAGDWIVGHLEFSPACGRMTP